MVVFGEYGETVAEFVRKGSQVLVEGRVRISEKGHFSVVADRVVFGSTPQQNNESDLVVGCGGSPRSPATPIMWV